MLPRLGSSYHSYFSDSCCSDYWKMHLSVTCTPGKLFSNFLLLVPMQKEIAHTPGIIFVKIRCAEVLNENKHFTFRLKVSIIYASIFRILLK